MQPHTNNLHWYGSRWYDDSLGRFISPDTIIPSPGYSGDWDRYAYVQNNPIKYIDPSGHNPECGPDGIFCNSQGQVMSNEDIFDAMLDYGWFDPMPSTSVISDSRYNTPERGAAVIQNYDQFRRSLFAIFGFGSIGKFLVSNGQLTDQVFMALIAGEFSSESGDVYLECIEALSNQYYGETTDNPGPMRCYGNCTLEYQLLWATQMQAWYSSAFENKFINTSSWTGQLNGSQMAIKKYYHEEDSSWFWGNVSEVDLVKYDIVIQRYSDPPVYPEKPYFIVYKLWDH